jgi:hypothetical protein
MLARFDARGIEVGEPGWNGSDRPGSVLSMAIGHLEDAEQRLREVLINVRGIERPATTLDLLAIADATGSAIHALMLLCESARIAK